MTTDVTQTGTAETTVLDPPELLSLNVPGPMTPPGTMVAADGSIGTVGLSRTFVETFDGFVPNRAPWRHHFDHGPYEAIWARTLSGNMEEQVYVDPGFAGKSGAPLGLDPFSVDGGVLKITGGPVASSVARHLDGYRYMSGLLSSEVAFEQQYGFFEARMRLPEGQGVWPAFWLKRAARLAPEGTPSWPPEIDVMEYIGTEGGQYHTTVHWGLQPDNEMSGASNAVAAPSGRFHNYGVLWMADRTVFYLDRKPVRVIETKDNHHVPMFMMLNLALGGRWPGPVDPKILPVALEIDWVAAWQVSSTDIAEAVPPVETDLAGLETSNAVVDAGSFFRLTNAGARWGSARLRVATAPGDRLILSCKVTPETAPGRVCVREAGSLAYLSDAAAPGGTCIEALEIVAPGDGLEIEFQTLSNQTGASAVFSDLTYSVMRSEAR